MKNIYFEKAASFGKYKLNQNLCQGFYGQCAELFVELWALALGQALSTEMAKAQC